MKISDDNKRMAMLLSKMVRSFAWKRIVQELDEYMNQSMEMVMQPGTDQDKRFTQRDFAADRYNHLKFLKNLPNSLIQQLSGTGTEQVESYDPYETSTDEEESQDLSSY